MISVKLVGVMVVKVTNRIMIMMGVEVVKAKLGGVKIDRSGGEENQR